MPRPAHEELAELLRLRKLELAELLAGNDAHLPSLQLALAVAPIRRLYSWAVPTDEALEVIAAASPRGVVEVGAGTGLWAKLLQQRGVKVAAYDRCGASGRNPYNGESPPFMPVLRGKRFVLHAHPECSLLLCWPPSESGTYGAKDESTATMGVDALKSYSGNTVAYVGELRNGGATGGDRLHDALARGFSLQRTLALPNWPGASDNLTLWRRKHPRPEARNFYVKWPAPTTVGHPPEVEAETAAQRAEMLDSINASWAAAAAAHISSRRLQGGGGSANEAERRLVDEACRRAPLMRRVMLRMLCR